MMPRGPHAFQSTTEKWMGSEDYAICLVAGLLRSLHAGYAGLVGDICSVLQFHPEMLFAFVCRNAWSIGLSLSAHHLNL
jgi:hypothetical protein